jgi:hypothetical protein
LYGTLFALDAVPIVAPRRFNLSLLIYKLSLSRRLQTFVATATKSDVQPFF